MTTEAGLRLRAVVLGRQGGVPWPVVGGALLQSDTVKAVKMGTL